MLTNSPAVLVGLIGIHEMHQNPKKTWEVICHLRIAFAQLLAGHKDILYEIIYMNIRSMAY